MSERPKILVVEDSLPLAQTISRWLGQAGYEVLVALSGEEALLELEKNPEIGLIDHQLPGISGLELVKKIQSDGTIKIPLLMMSADNTEMTINKTLQSGCVDFIAKPLTKSELLLRIGIHYKLKQRELELQEISRKLEKEKKLLSKYFSDDLVDSILNETIQTNLGGNSLVASILFFDLRNSTGISNEMNSSEFADFLSLVLTDIMDLIYGCQGSVNKFLGDGILATFGCPIPSDTDAYNSVLCGRKILEYLKMFNEFRPATLKEPIKAGIGIATGKVFAGNIGSVRRMEYTVLGDAVNIASRLESLTKFAGIPILIDENTFQKLTLSDFSFIETKIHNVKGITEAMNIYTLETLTTE